MILIMQLLTLFYYRWDTPEQLHEQNHIFNKYFQQMLMPYIRVSYFYVALSLKELKILQ